MEIVIEFLGKLASMGVKLSVEAGQLNCYAQKGMLTNDIRDGITEHKSEIIALLQGMERRQDAQVDKSSLKESTEFPLSTGQKGLYILQALYPEMSAYNVPLCFRITGEINTKLFAKAWAFVLEQFPILSTRVI